jgi:hypothetical protein
MEQGKVEVDEMDLEFCLIHVFIILCHADSWMY